MNVRYQLPRSAAIVIIFVVAISSVVLITHAIRTVNFMYQYQDNIAAAGFDQ